MRIRPYLLCVCSVFLLASAASAMPESECIAAWAQADENNDGVLTASERRNFFAVLRNAHLSVPGEKLTQAEFLNHCRADVFKT